MGDCGPLKGELRKGQGISSIGIMHYLASILYIADNTDSLLLKGRVAWKNRYQFYLLK